PKTLDPTTDTPTKTARYQRKPNPRPSTIITGWPCGPGPDQPSAHAIVRVRPGPYSSRSAGPHLSRARQPVAPSLLGGSVVSPAPQVCHNVLMTHTSALIIG